MARGTAATATELFSLSVINYASVVVNGVAVTDSLMNILIKYKDGSRINSRDLHYFILSCGFFLNAFLSTELAERLIRTLPSTDTMFNVVNNSISTLRLLLNGENGWTVLYATAIVGGVFLLTRESFLSCIRNVSIFVDQYFRGKINIKDLRMELSREMRPLWGNVVEHLKKCVKRVKSLFGRAFYKNKVLAEMSPDQITEFCDLLSDVVGCCYGSDSCSEDERDYLNLSTSKLIKQLCDELDSEIGDNAGRYLVAAKLVTERLKEEFLLEKVEYDYKVDLKTYNNPNEVDTLSEYKTDLLIKKAINKLKTADGINCMSIMYRELIAGCNGDVRLPATPYLKTDYVTVYSFTGKPLQKTFTDDEYMEKCNSIADLALDTDNWSVVKGKDADIVNIEPKTGFDTSIKMVIMYSAFDEVHLCHFGTITIVDK